MSTRQLISEDSPGATDHLSQAAQSRVVDSFDAPIARPCDKAFCDPSRCEYPNCIGLDCVKVGSRARVAAVTTADRSMSRRLLAMGVVAGTEIFVQSIAPLGDPMQIETLGYKLSLRRSEAAHVRVVLLSEKQTTQAP